MSILDQASELPISSFLKASIELPGLCEAGVLIHQETSGQHVIQGINIYIDVPHTDTAVEMSQTMFIILRNNKGHGIKSSVTSEQWNLLLAVGQRRMYKDLSSFNNDVECIRSVAAERCECTYSKNVSVLVIKKFQMLM